MSSRPNTCSPGPTLLSKQLCAQIWRNLLSIFRIMVIFLDNSKYIRLIFKSIYDCFTHYFTVKKYSWLVDGTAQARVDQFMDGEHSFEEYTEVISMSLMLFGELLSPFSGLWCLTVYSHNFFSKQVEEFYVLSKEILSLPAKVYFTMIHLDCEELKQGLAKKAKSYAEKLLERIITTHRQQTLKLVTFVNVKKKCFLVTTTSVNLFFLF